MVQLSHFVLLYILLFSLWSESEGYEVKRRTGLHGNRRFEVVGVGGEGSGLIREREKCSRSRKGKRRGAVRGIGGLGGGRAREISAQIYRPAFS